MDGQALRIDLEHARARIALETTGKIFQPGLPIDRRHAQTGELGGNAEVVQPRLSAAPAESQRVYTPLGLQRLQAGAQRGIHRQARQHRLPAAQTQCLRGDLMRCGIPRQG